MNSKTILAGALSLAALSPGAQSAPAPFSMPQSQVVRLGLDGFMDAYSKRTKDDSTQGQVAGYRYFQRSQRAANDAASTKLAASRRSQVASARRELGALGEAAWAMCSIAAGGGTMWSQGAAASSAKREESLARVIRALRQAKPSAADARQVQALIGRAQGDLKLFEDQASGIDGAGAAPQAQARRDYGLSLRRAQNSLARLRTLSLALPGPASRDLARCAADEIHFVIQLTR